MTDIALKDRRQELIDRPDLKGTAFCTALSRAADESLATLAERAADGDPRKMALIAVGGYGRGELCPYSDLDVMLVHEGRRDVGALADAIWYPIWDQAIKLDHSVRRPREVLTAAHDDLRVALGLLDARHLWGDPKVSEPLLDDIVALWRNRLSARWLPVLSEQMQKRHEEHGEVAFLLEPDLKEGRGGLRDAVIWGAISHYAPTLGAAIDLDSMAAAAGVLTEARVELHRQAGRDLDRLLLQEQDHVAERLGDGDADRLMARISRAGRRISWLSDDAWAWRSVWEPGPRSKSRGRRRGRIDRPSWSRRRGTVAADSRTEVESGLAIESGVVVLTDEAIAWADSSIGLRLVAVAAEHDLPVALSVPSFRQLVEWLPAPSDPWPEETRRALVRVLETGRASIRAMEALDQYDLLSRLLPEWEHVRHRPQRNAYHRFTVDRHLLETAANGAALLDRVERNDLLVLGCLLHDIGKGYPGDHTDVGIELVASIGQRMGYPPADVDTLVSLVRNHLLLADTATRRDLDDPQTIRKVADAVGNVATLNLLAALTEADSLATGTSAWGSWKAGLVHDLVVRTSAYLEGDAQETHDGWITNQHRWLMKRALECRAPVVFVDEPRVVVAAPDRPGLFAFVAGVLAVHGLDVRSADATSERGAAVEVFTVDAPRGRWPDDNDLSEHLGAVLVDEDALVQRLDQRARLYESSRRPTSAHGMTREVLVDNDASETSTVIEVRAPNELGLLHRVTKALFERDMNVISARVSTIGSDVVDAFYVRNADGTKIADRSDVESVIATLEGAIGSRSSSAPH